MNSYDVSIYDFSRRDRNFTFANKDNGKERVIVYFERPTEQGFDAVSCELPEYKWIFKEEKSMFIQSIKNIIKLKFRRSIYEAF